MVDIALFQPEIPQNTGTMIRLAACLSVGMHIVEPAGFILSDKNLRRAGMDYIEKSALQQHASWDHFLSWCDESQRRIILLTTKAEASFLDFDFLPDDILLAGRESAGVPDYVHEAAGGRITIPMAANRRSLNVAISVSMVLTEALRQTETWPKPDE